MYKQDTGVQILLVRNKRRRGGRVGGRGEKKKSPPQMKMELDEHYSGYTIILTCLTSLPTELGVRGVRAAGVALPNLPS